jgi:vancomycin permeability regulator SanA
MWLLAAILICVRGLSIPYDKADVALVFGNALEDNGTPKPILMARLDTAVQCYRTGYCSTLFGSGSIDGPGLNEATAMEAYLVAHGVPVNRIVVDDQGINTLATARNAARYMQARQVSRVMLISQYYHLARAQLAFSRTGAQTVYGAFPRLFRVRDLYSSWREVPAFAVYSLRLSLDPDAKPVLFRPMLFLFSLFSGSH